jgi:hypothetical protein
VNAERSLVMIVPAAARAQANALAISFRHASPGDDPFDVPLSPTGAEPATHYGTHTWASAQFVADLDAAQAGTLDPLPPGVDRAALQSLVTLIVRSVRPLDADPPTHFAEALAAHGLQRIVTASMGPA